MTSITKRRLASPAIAIVAVATFAGVASAAQPTTTTQLITMPAASEAVIGLPALNSQFTSMVLTADGTAHWGQGVYPYNGNEYTTTYTNGNMTTGVPATTGIAPGWGPLVLEGTQVGSVIYRIDGGAWQPLSHTTPITVTDGGTHHVQVTYNDRPGSYGDNSGSLSLTVVHTKA